MNRSGDSPLLGSLIDSLALAARIWRVLARVPTAGYDLGVHSERIAETIEGLVFDVSPARWAACKAAGWVAPAAFWSRLGGLRLRRVAMPGLPRGDWVRLRPKLGGICGTDLSNIMQKHHPASILAAFSSFPAGLGHENVSVVDEVGPDVARWQRGDRVVVEPSLSCRPRGVEPICSRCAAGSFTLCENFRTGPLPAGSMIGWNSFTGGSWWPYFVAHESQLYRVPDGIDDEQALLVDPMAGGLHAVLRRRPGDDETVLILGSGLVGMGVAAGIRSLGCSSRLVAICRHDRQGALMKRFGVDEVIRVGRSDDQATRYRAVANRVGGKVVPSRFGHQAVIGGFDVVYDCIGSGQSLTDAMKYVRPRGTVVEVGTSQIALVDTCPLWFDELNLIGANGRSIEQYNGQSKHTYEVVFDLMRQGLLDVSGLVTHRFRPAQYRQAFWTLVNRGKTGAIKVAFTQD